MFPDGKTLCFATGKHFVSQPETKYPLPETKRFIQLEASNQSERTFHVSIRFNLSPIYEYKENPSFRKREGVNSTKQVQYRLIKDEVP